MRISSTNRLRSLSPARPPIDDASPSTQPLTAAFSPSSLKLPQGLFGYFPTYTLGAMAAVQIYDAAAAALPGLGAQVAAGEFKPLREWLRAQVHEVGSLHPTADELLVAVTGKPLDPAVFMRYLSSKYKALYKLA